MTISKSPRTWAIASIAANRIVIYGRAAIRGSAVERLALLFLPVSAKKEKVVKAFLSTSQFVVAAIDGLAILIASSFATYEERDTATPFQIAMAASQFAFVAGLGLYYLRVASKRYGVVLVDTSSIQAPTLIPVWVPSR